MGKKKNEKIYVNIFRRCIMKCKFKGEGKIYVAKVLGDFFYVRYFFYTLRMWECVCVPT